MNRPQMVFWSSAFLLFYVYLGYPLLLFVLALFRRSKPPKIGYTPFLSILIAASNEEADIGRKLEETLQLDYPAGRMEILVLSDGSCDRTDEIVKEFAGRGVRLIKIPERGGKTNAQNHGATEARGQVLVFSDATTTYHSLALRYLACRYQDYHVGAVSGRYQYFDPQQSSPTGAGTIAFWNYENNIKMQQSQVGTLTGCCGCIYSVRRDLYTILPPDVISDLVQPLWVIQQGFRVVFEHRALAYEQTTESVAEEFAMRVRVITRGMRGLLSVSGLLNPLRHPWAAFQLVSHKILRWLVPVFLLLLFSASVALRSDPRFLAVLLLQLCFYAAALLQAFLPVGKRWKPLALPLYFCTLNAAALCSTVELFRGRKYAVWQPVRK